MRPNIGIIEWPYKDSDGDIIYEILMPIVEWVIRCGGNPIGIYPPNIDAFLDKRISEIKSLTDIEIANLKDNLKLCDAIIKPGATRIYNHERMIYDIAYKNNIPYLGICAGMQIMANHNSENIINVKNDSDIKHHSKEIYAHEVSINTKSNLYKMLKKEIIMVNSRHNYHVGNTNNNIVCASANDGIVEAIENPYLDFHLGLQWHPELLPSNDENSNIIFNELIEHAKVYKLKK